MAPGIRVRMMARRNRQIAALGLLSTAAVAILVIRVSTQRMGIAVDDSTGNSPTPESREAIEVHQAANHAAAIIRGPLTLERDLFAWEKVLPPVGVGKPAVGRTIQQEAAESIRLQAIVLRGDSAQVIINGQVKRLGDSVEGFRIQRIEEHRIVVEKDAVEIEIEL